MFFFLPYCYPSPAKTWYRVHCQGLTTLYKMLSHYGHVRHQWCVAKKKLGASFLSDFEILALNQYHNSVNQKIKKKVLRNVTEFIDRSRFNPKSLRTQPSLARNISMVEKGKTTFSTIKWDALLFSKLGSKIKGIFDNITFGLSSKQKSTPQHFECTKNKAKQRCSKRKRLLLLSLLYMYVQNDNYCYALLYSCTICAPLVTFEPLCRNLTSVSTNIKQRGSWGESRDTSNLSGLKWTA